MSVHSQLWRDGDSEMIANAQTVDLNRVVSPVIQSLQDNFVCTKCGKCCREGGNPVLTEHDIDEISIFLDVDPHDKSFIPVAHVVGRPDLYGLTLTRPCFFHEKVGNECSIHECKPQNCRDWPFVAFAKGTCDLEHVLICPEARKLLYDLLGVPCFLKSEVVGSVPRCLHQRVDECTASVICVINRNNPCPLAGKHDKTSCLGFVRVDPEQHPETGLP